MDWDREGLLEGLDGAQRDARRRLLDDLHSEGISVEELRRAVAEDRLALLPVERRLLAPPRFTAEQAAGEAGLDVETFVALGRAIGQPMEAADAVAYGDDDVEAARRVAAYIQAGLPRDEILELVRVMSSSVGRSAEGIRTMFGRAFLRAGDTEEDLGLRYAQMAEALLPVLVKDFDFLMRVQLREYTRSDAIGIAERTTGAFADSTPVAVGFVDLVGFTALGEEIDEVALSGVADRLTSLAHHFVKPPVRLVKTIGDAVMFVSLQPRELLEVLLDLLEAVEGDESLPALRGGAAWGPAVARYGDWYGSTVNLAARVAARARSGSILVSDSLGEALGDASAEFSWSAAGPKNLRGFSAPVTTWRVRRADSSSGTSGGHPAG